MFLLLATTVALAVQAAPPRVSLVSYDEAVRCAGLAQAASELEGGESSAGKSLFDVALYWSLAAGQAATAAGKSANTADADQNRARLLAVRQLNAGDEEARAALRRCRARTPHLG